MVVREQEATKQKSSTYFPGVCRTVSEYTLEKRYVLRGAPRDSERQRLYRPIIASGCRMMRLLRMRRAACPPETR